MNKSIKNAAIYLKVKSEKEDNYFISQKIDMMKEVCMENDLTVTDVYMNYGMSTLNFFKKYIKEMKEKQIKVLITEESEQLLSIIDIGLVDINILDYIKGTNFKFRKNREVIRDN